MFPVLLLLWKNVLTRYWEITKKASAWRSEDTRDYAKVSVRLIGLVSDRVYLAAAFLLWFCSRASRTYCSIRHLENCDPVISNVKGVVEIFGTRRVFHGQGNVGDHLGADNRAAPMTSLVVSPHFLFEH